MHEDNDDSALQSYLAIAYSFIIGLLRVWEAEAALARLMAALTEFKSRGKVENDSLPGTTADHLKRVDAASYDSLRYVSDVSHLVYATTLLDTFLTETTTFLFLLFPRAMGKNQQISLSTLLDADHKNGAITEAASGRAREISYLPFLGRLQVLKDSFGLNIGISDDLSDSLSHYSTVRNTAVHDQGIFQLSLDGRNRITVQTKTCSRHPTKLSDDDVHRAIRTYEEIGRAIARAVLIQVLKGEADASVQQFFAIRSSTSAAKSD